MPGLDLERVDRLLHGADGNRWKLPREALAAALEASVAKAFADRTPAAPEIDRYLSSLHLADLALACACSLGNGEAWEHFVLEFRPLLYRSADAIARGGAAREVADALYAELYGLKDHHGARQSLFRYFHGRSSLATWLRALVAQRYVDVVRVNRRTEPLPADASPAAFPARLEMPDPDRRRFASAMRHCLGSAIAQLPPRDRLRLGCYYAEQMTLARIGRLVGEHEATVSRHLARTRRQIREAVEPCLRNHHGFGEREVAECFTSLAADPGALDLGEWLGDGEHRKESALNRSTIEDHS